jgi:hypothetical protein
MALKRINKVCGEAQGRVGAGRRRASPRTHLLQTGAARRCPACAGAALSCARRTAGRGQGWGGEAVRQKVRGERGEGRSGGPMSKALRTVAGTGHSNDRRVAFRLLTRCCATRANALGFCLFCGARGMADSSVSARHAS